MFSYVIFALLLTFGLCVPIEQRFHTTVIGGQLVTDLTGSWLEYNSTIFSSSNNFVWDKFDSPSPNGASTVYLVKDIDQAIIDHGQKLDSNLRFLSVENKESLYFDKELNKYIKAKYDLENIKYSDYIVQHGCLDVSSGESGSLTASVQLSFGSTLNIANSLSLQIAEMDISLTLSILDSELEFSVLASFTSSASCNFQKGEYGTLSTTFFIVESSPSTLETGTINKQRKFVIEKESKLNSVIKLITSKVPITVCSCSKLAC